MKEHFMKTEVDWEEEIKTHCIFVEKSSGDLCQSEKKSFWELDNWRNSLNDSGFTSNFIA